PEKYFRSHPYRRTLLAIHPVEKFGCTTCHDGQGRATTRFHAHAPTDKHHDAEKHFWEFPLLRGAYVESECRQCHRQEYALRAGARSSRRWPATAAIRSRATNRSRRRRPTCATRRRSSTPAGWCSGS